MAFHRVNLGSGVLSAHPMWADFPRGGLVSLPPSSACDTSGRQGETEINIVLYAH